MASSADVNQELSKIQQGDRQAPERLMELVYDDMRGLANNYLKQDSGTHTLQPTALVNEAFLKLADSEDVDFNGRSHFFAVGARAMRQILVDYARSKSAVKRGSGTTHISLDEKLILSSRRDEDVLAIDEALQELAELDARQAQIVEFRFFGGLTVEQVSVVLGVSKRTVEAEWTMIRAWLRKQLSDSSNE